MRNLFIAASVATGLATSALAGAVDVVIAEEPAMVEAVVPVADWSGLYAGGTGSFVTDGTSTYMYSGTPGDFYDLDGQMYGAFGGYNVQRGQLVFGGEVAYLAGEYFSGYESNNSAANFSSMLDMKARVGYVAGSALVYGFVGGSSGVWDNANSLTNPDATGMNYGAGVDYLVSNRIFIGAEYIYRDLSTEFNENDNGVENPFSAVQLRIGMTF